MAVKTATVKAEGIKPGHVVKSSNRWFEVVAIKSVTDWAITLIVNDSAGKPAGYLSVYRDGLDYQVKAA
jgi:hypothetical protein